MINISLVSDIKCIYVFTVNNSLRVYLSRQSGYSVPTLITNILLRQSVSLHRHTFQYKLCFRDVE
ncbi:hypothetical protein BABINDRAFT_138485 [Babjeviella inositovora NRRL Y-12698]|uniref:Uncharacterized protein n=1 Tax=Babjeviella inositovora NRRL Y-12698 TaxID=984486 RepID=A0A1E3QQP3_9ASCO|nr:uncharacterized protein BABINDRAFT_138485 [Babjeviella inositovora NRRL Y-12698]ODQ80001.1 hypothetical protein BABINDRAFT_138485 [Babjeviella inositovora NRRL Y-12698]